MVYIATSRRNTARHLDARLSRDALRNELRIQAWIRAVKSDLDACYFWLNKDRIDVSEGIIDSLFLPLFMLCDTDLPMVRTNLYDFLVI